MTGKMILSLINLLSNPITWMTLMTSRGQQEGNYLNKTKHLLLIVNIQARNTYALCMTVGWKSWIVHLSILVPLSLPHSQLYCIIAPFKVQFEACSAAFYWKLQMILSESHLFKKSLMFVIIKKCSPVYWSPAYITREKCAASPEDPDNGILIKTGTIIFLKYESITRALGCI